MLIGIFFVIFAIGFSTLSASFSDEIILVNQQINISSDFENTKAESQPFAYIVQISNNVGQIISISYITGSLGAGQALEQNLSYIPQDTGDYKVEKFLWSDMNEPTALTVKPEAKIINVVQTSEQQIQETPQQTVQTELTASTSKSSYNAGDTILVTGTASSDYEYNQPVTIQIINPQGNIVAISQVQPNSYNVFSQSIATSLGGLWSDAGVYQIMIQHGAKETGTSLISLVVILMNHHLHHLYLNLNP